MSLRSSWRPMRLFSLISLAKLTRLLMRSMSLWWPNRPMSSKDLVDKADADDVNNVDTAIAVDKVSDIIAHS